MTRVMARWWRKRFAQIWRCRWITHRLGYAQQTIPNQTSVQLMTSLFSTMGGGVGDKLRGIWWYFSAYDLLAIIIFIKVFGICVYSNLNLGNRSRDDCSICIQLRFWICSSLSNQPVLSFLINVLFVLVLIKSASHAGSALSRYRSPANHKASFLLEPF